MRLTLRWWVKLGAFLLCTGQASANYHQPRKRRRPWNLFDLYVLYWTLHLNRFNLSNFVAHIAFFDIPMHFSHRVEGDEIHGKIRWSGCFFFLFSLCAYIPRYATFERIFTDIHSEKNPFVGESFFLDAWLQVKVMGRHRAIWCRKLCIGSVWSCD